MSKQHPRHIDGVIINFEAARGIKHPKKYLYDAFHGAFPCYVCSNEPLKHGQFIPFDQMAQQFNGAAIGGMTTYVFTPPPKKLSPGEKIFNDGKDVLKPEPLSN